MPVNTNPQIRTAPVTRLYDSYQFPKYRCLTLRQGQYGTAETVLTTEAGDPMDLSAWNGAAYTFALRGMEAVRIDQASRFESFATITDAANGVVRASIPTTPANNPGVYLLEIGVTDDTLYPRAAGSETVSSLGNLNTTTYRITTTGGNYDYPIPVTAAVGVGTAVTAKQQLVVEHRLVWSTQLYLLVERGLFGTPSLPDAGPPTTQDVRLHLRDFPESNRLLDEYEFDDAEVAGAAVRCVQFYNNARPQVGPVYDTRSFPHRYFWLEGIVAELFVTAAHYHRRNSLAYSAAGVQVQDIGKDPQYLQALQMHRQSWETFVKQTKVNHNIEDGYGTLGSVYGRFAGW